MKKEIKIDKQETKKRYWLRGGVIGLIIGILLAIFLSNARGSFGGMFVSLLTISFSLFILFVSFFTPKGTMAIDTLRIAILTGSAVYGIIIGWLHGINKLIWDRYRAKSKTEKEVMINEK